MAWRIHLTNQAIRDLHVLPGKPSILAVWTHWRQVYYYNFDNGTPLTDQRLPNAPQKPRHSDIWQAYVGNLKPPNSAQFLPVVRTPQAEIHTTDDGKLRLYHQREGGLTMETNGLEEALAVVDAQQFIAVDLDRALGMVVALDETGHLHIYQQNIRLGRFDLGLQLHPDLRPAVAVSRGGGSIFASDGKRLVVTDSSGKVLKQQEMHYYIGHMAVSPGGGMILTSDMESGVLRVYHAESLILTHQKFAIDLVADATQVQLMADLPPMGTAISALSAYVRGVFAFAMSGVVCVTGTEYMDRIPRPKALL